MRRLTLVLVFTAPLLLSGCDFLDRLFGKVDDTVQQARGKQRPWPALPEADIRNQGPVSGRQLTNAAAQVIGGGAAETDPGRVTFDGGVLRDSVGGIVRSGDGSPVSVGGRFEYGARPPVQYTPGQPRRSTLSADVPAPELTLPAGGRADGSARGAGPTLAQYDAFQRMPGLFSAVYDVVSRAGWGAQAPRSSPDAHTPTKVTVHHTDGPQTMTLAESMRVVKNIQHYHRNIADRRKGGVWNDIGYHFLIDGGGRIFEGRHAEHIGAHAGSGYNTGNIGISMMGNFDRNQLTDPQRDALVRLVTFLSIKYRRDPSANGFIEPHEHYAEMSGGGTDCPGRNVLSFLQSGELIRRASGEIARLGQDSRFRPQIIASPGGTA